MRRPSQSRRRNLMTSDSKFLTDVQLAERWHLSRKSLIKWRGEGKGPAFTKVGGRVLYKMADVEQFEEANRKTTDS